MLPFGKLEQDYGSAGSEWIKRTRAQEMSVWRTRFERAGCEVERESEGRLSVLLPGWDGSLGGAEARVENVQRWFWDRMIITVSEAGAARFRLVYFTPVQLFLHLLVTAFFVFELWFGASVPREPTQFALMFAATQVVPLLVTLGGFKLALGSALKRASEA